ncbi:coiled-coil domain-containing protein 74B [Genypterus blacodes]|uniref:coiled-coil domain-containing protein 74B n=1 Tax=Genypterus blacodes TaxID=154954 RepID=UPI003F771388
MQQSQNLPPVRNLPHWSRVGCLGKLSSPRRLPESHPRPLPVAPAADRGALRSGGDVEQRRVASLQNDIVFLQQQHKETLQRLHAEVDHLRRENKELQYRLIMEPPKSSRKATTPSRRSIRPPTQGSEAHAEIYLEQSLQDTRPTQDQTLEAAESGEIEGSSRPEPDSEPKGGLITSLQPLRIHSSASHPPRAPTLKECEIIIRQLYNANSLQSQEILRVKALLRDIVFSKKITPENYILTKAYLADGSRKSSEVERLPKLGHQTFPEKTFGSSQRSVTLPALRQSLTSTIADRQRRTCAVQGNRFKRTVQ